MDAETAGSGAVTSTPESNTSTASSEVQPKPGAGDEPGATDESSFAEIASSDRLKAILEEEGLPAEEIEQVTKPKGKTDAKTSESPEVKREKTEAGRSDAEKEAKQEKDGKPQGKAAGEGEEEALTEEQKKSWPPDALGRIHRAVGQRNEARKEAQQLRQQLQRASTAQRPTPTAEDPLADVATPAEMEAAIKEYRDMRYFAEMNPDGKVGVVVGKDAKGDDITQDFSAEDMARIRAEAGRILDEHVPQRVAILREQSLHEQVAKERLPEMFQEGTEAHAFYQNALRDLPGLRNIPGMANMIRWAWMGRQADIAAGKKSEVGDQRSDKKVDPKVAPFLQRHPPMAPGAPEARVQGGSAGRNGDGKGSSGEKVTQAEKRVEAGEGEEAEVEFIESLRESQAPRNGEVLV